MYDLNNLSAEEIDQLTMDVVEFSQKSEDEIFHMIGKTLDLEGLEVASSDSKMMIRPKNALLKGNNLSLLNTFDYIEKSVTPPDIVLKTDGKKFWEGVKGRIKHEICTNETIRRIMSSPDKVKEIVIELLKIIVMALFKKPEVSLLDLARIAAVIALLMIYGYNDFCGISATV